MILPASASESNRLGMQFLHIELSLAHTFLDSADISHWAERKQRGRDDAEVAYRSVLKFMGRVRFTREQRVDFEGHLESVRVRLVGAGMKSPVG